MTIDWWTLFLQTANFLLLVWLLQHFLYKPVRAVIEKRRALAEEALLKAETTEKGAQAAQSEFEAETAELEQTREAVIRSTRQSGEAEAKKIVAEARRQADGILAAAQKAAEESHAEALETVKQDVVETAVEIAGTILRKTAQSSLDAVFLARLLDEIDSLSDEDRARVDDDIANGNGRVDIATPMQLKAHEREAWEKALTDRLHLRQPPRFVVDPELLGGAELRSQHATVRFAWSDQLEKAAEILKDSAARGGPGD
jgi:F-type H+-transporting ATPase subunit b